MEAKHSHGVSLQAVVGAVAVVAIAGIAATFAVHVKLVAVRSELATTTAMYEAKVHELATELTDRDARLAVAADQNTQYNSTIDELASSVATYEKLSKTDRELLQKYSNVFFLSDNYVPSQLVPIDKQYVFGTDKDLQIHANIKTPLENMMRNATNQGAPLLVLSAYRSFGTQAGLKASYSVTYGKGTANQFSADQGYSEHQLGSAVDFTTPDGGGALNATFEKSPGFVWLQEHAHEYGFILSYPKGNKYFVYEPWHWRFVGVQLATKLHNEKIYFYDLDQREINGFLVTIFD